MSKLTPTQRTMALFQSRGYSVQRVERWVPTGRGSGHRKDFLGVIDFLALKAGEPVIGIQSCGQNLAAHRRKIESKRAAVDLWLSTGCRMVLVGWRGERFTEEEFHTPRSEDLGSG